MATESPNLAGDRQDRDSDSIKPREDISDSCRKDRDRAEVAERRGGDSCETNFRLVSTSVVV